MTAWIKPTIKPLSNKLDLQLKLNQNQYYDIETSHILDFYFYNIMNMRTLYYHN